MQYFRSGRRVIRVDTDAPLGDDFLKARAETYSLEQDTWVAREGMTSQIMFSGDWNPCTAEQAFLLIEQRRKRHALLT